jgi:hypothetical protein
MFKTRSYCRLIDSWDLKPEPQHQEHQQHAEVHDDTLPVQQPIGQPQATVDQNHSTSYQNTHDEQFSQEIVFGEQDFAFFDFDMAAVDNMGSSENMVSIPLCTMLRNTLEY